VTPPGLQRRRLIPAPLPDTSSLGRKVGAAGQWVDLPPLGGTIKEPFEIKVYEIDDVERLQRRKEGLAEVRCDLYGICFSFCFNSEVYQKSREIKNCECFQVSYVMQW